MTEVAIPQMGPIGTLPPRPGVPGVAGAPAVNQPPRPGVPPVNGQPQVGQARFNGTLTQLVRENISRAGGLLDQSLASIGNVVGQDLMNEYTRSAKALKIATTIAEAFARADNSYIDAQKQIAMAYA